MKITEILEQIPIGGTVTNRMVLSVLKRAGVIYDYSRFGYLESQKVHANADGYTFDHYEEFGKELKDNKFNTIEDLWNWRKSLKKEYKGFGFDTKYLSGCFQPYLIKVSGPTRTHKKANPTISLFGVVL